MVHFIYRIKGPQPDSYNKSQIKIAFLSQKIVFDFANRVDPDEIVHNVVFHLDLHCLPKYLFRGHHFTKG